ncbi:hypothetical protein ACFL6P_08035 [Candidatus Latescibacterota bacterium]
MGNRLFCIIVVHILMITVMSGTVSAETHITVSSAMTPPAWALMERELLDAGSDAVEKFYEYYFDEKGYLLHTPRWDTLDGTDDAPETYYNWTLLYALGGSDRVLDLYEKGQEGHFLQYKDVTTDSTEVAENGCYYKEFMPMSDWHHNGESLQAYILYGLCNPADVKFQNRFRRFAGLYMNEDPEAPNYDPEHKIIRSIWNGSKGPMLRRATMYDWVGDPNSGRFHILHSAEMAAGRSEMLDFEDAYPDMLWHCAEYLHSAGDHPLNLIATYMPLNAFMLSHEKKYRDWIVEYVDAWKERTIMNGGNIPSNIGLDGSIGGETGGKWYGGAYGWDFAPWSPEHKKVAYRNMFAKGMWPGFGTALLVTGDQSYVDVLRTQMDNMYAQKKVIDGQLMIPHNYGVKGNKTSRPDFKFVNGLLVDPPHEGGTEGWYNYMSDLMLGQLIEIYMWSMNRKDLGRIESDKWIQYLEGNNPDYPETALANEFTLIRERMEGMRNDPTTPDTRLADWALEYNPAVTHELTKLMLGGYLPEKYVELQQTGHWKRIWILHSRLRYFDPERNRAGIPEDVAALVSEMTDDHVNVTLVNVSQTKAHDVIVQTGGYGEHQCLSVEIDGDRIPVNNRYFTVHLAPGSGAEMVINNKRYANHPTLSFPWHGGIVPAP